MLYSFHHYTLDEDRHELRRSGQLVSVEPKVFQVLVYLLHHQDRVVSKDELLNQCWPDTFVSESALTRCLTRLRRTVQPKRTDSPVIKTVHKLGYRFIALVTLLPDESTPNQSVTEPLLQSSRGPSREADLVQPAPSPEPFQLQSFSEASSLAASLVPVAERRQLTVLFCDLVGSTALAERLGPEDFHEVLRAYSQICVEVINRFDGYVAQYLGDGLLVYFGYPLAHEDDAKRAVHTGLGIIAAIDEMNTRFGPDRGIQLEVRLGIHTGLVVMGDIGMGGRVEQLAVGIVPNIAARLQDIAEPGTVLVSNATYRLIDGYFMCKDMGEHTPRGTSQTLSIYHVLQESSAQTRLDIAVAKGLTPLVGRTQEVSTLLDRWARVRDGKGQVVVLSGEAGIGKSRLVHMLDEHIANEPHLLLECRSSPYYQQTALYPVATLFRDALQWTPEDTVNEKLDKLETILSQYRLPLGELVPLFANLLSLSLPANRYPPVTLAPQRQRQKIMETLLIMLLEQATQQPVLLIVEDLHWSDAATLEFLTLLVSQVPTVSLYALFTCRPSFQSPWSSHSYLTQVTLDHLSHDDITEMVAWITGGKRLPQEVMQHVKETADGVPLFVEELTKAILESGLLRERQDHYEQPGPLPRVAIPTTLQDSLMARLGHLGVAKDVAQIGAVIGREFTYEVLQAISSWDDEVLHQELGRLVDAELLYQRGVVPRVTYLFKHSLIRDAAYESLMKSARQQQHLKIAHALEDMYAASLEEHILAIAHHLVQAGSLANPEKVARYSREAGDYALSSFAWREGAHYYTAALSATRDALSIQQQAELHYTAGVAYYWDGDIPTCLDHYDQAIAAYRLTGDIRRLANVLMKKTYLTVGGSYGIPAQTSS